MSLSACFLVTPIVGLGSIFNHVLTHACFMGYAVSSNGISLVIRRSSLGDEIILLLGYVAGL